MNPGSIVRCRNRDWVLFPNDNADVYLLRPLTGATDEVVAVHKGLSQLVRYELKEEDVRQSRFDPPTVDDLSDAASADLLSQAARLTLREGATPFRSLGRISIRPRAYQFVPLLMALRLDPIRMLIADDVGVGKTIEALVIARELYERGEIKRMCVLCPPYLCDQWQTEISQKFNLEAVIIRSGTVGQLERRKTGTQSIYKHYPIQVASIDFLKTERNKNLFLLDCPEFVIVDEAHGAAVAYGSNQVQQQRHALVQDIAKAAGRHIVLLTATPHSGIEAAFQSLLGVLKPEFSRWQVSALKEPERIKLAKHFVQRTRRDIEKDWEGEHCFPTRDAADETYRLSKAYRELFLKTYDFCSEIVREGEVLDKRRRRVRYWGALALLRCVMSSPAAALAALRTRHDALTDADDEVDFRSFIFESSTEVTDDDQPTPPVESAEKTLDPNGVRRLRDLGRLANELIHSSHDTKLGDCATLVSRLLNDGFHPIIWCRYIATANYVAEGLQKALARLHRNVRVVPITGHLGDEERRAKINELAKDPVRVLVATDCLSEGVNLQDSFDAVLHYDLPWNPNRLEQREGRVDRYGQNAEVVKAIRYFSPDSAVDGVVLEVLLNKAREIHRTLGTYVPVPAEGETVTEAVLNALFLRGRKAGADQLQFDFGDAQGVEELHKSWDRDAERERVNRTRFAQRALKPDEVKKELEATDAVLGDPNAVRNFVLTAAQRIGLQIVQDKTADVFRIPVTSPAHATLPAAILASVPAKGIGDWRVSFISPTPHGAEYLGRNHEFVSTLARFLMEEALTKGAGGAASRCGVIRTRSLKRLTTILLLRIRYLLNHPERAPLLSEEVFVTGFIGATSSSQVGLQWLDNSEALRLLSEAKADMNVPMSEKRELINLALKSWPEVESALAETIGARAAELEKSHKRIRQAVSLRVRELTVEPQLPPDLLGVLVLQPIA
jgi:superfamily II DNA or RNA helicase